MKVEPVSSSRSGYMIRQAILESTATKMAVNGTIVSQRS